LEKSIVPHGGTMRYNVDYLCILPREDGRTEELNIHDTIALYFLQVFY